MPATAPKVRLRPATLSKGGNAMAKGVNKITLIGNLGRDPEMRYTPSGQQVTNFSIGVGMSAPDGNGGYSEYTMWPRVTVWGKSAEACNQYLKKGSKVYIEGRLECDKKTGGPRIWTRQDGTPGASFEVTARDVVFLSSKGEETGRVTGDMPGEGDGSEAPNDGGASEL